jgi:hypothetical protein
MPVSHFSESKLLSDLSPHRATSSAVHPGYEPLYVEYEPDTKPSYRPRRKGLATGRKPAGNYYQKLLRRRGKRQGRLGPYYDVESIEGSDMSDLLSDVDSVNGTYADNDSDYDSSPLPSYQHNQQHSQQDYGSDYEPPSSYSVQPYSYSPSSYSVPPSSYSVDPSSPYYVDQDTEFVPFKPSRPLLTKGLLEFSPYDDNNDTDVADDADDNRSEYSSVSVRPSPRTDLSLSRYLPPSLDPALKSVPTSATLTSSLPRPIYQTLLPFTSSTPSSTTTALAPATPSTSQRLLEELVASSLQRAKKALSDVAVPDYHNASLLLSVEGTGVSAGGRRIDFTYTPPPIPLYGSGLGLDDKLLALRPSTTEKPLDNFLSGYMQRMSSLRSMLNDRLDRVRRLELDARSWDSGSHYTPYKYTHSHDYLPVKHLTSQRLDRVPITTFRRRVDDDKTHRVDVIPLGEVRPRISSSSPRAISLPASATGGEKLSMLEKINIKVLPGIATPSARVRGLCRVLLNPL